MDSPSLKKIRSQPSDVIVAVGKGDAMQEFECYKIALCFASPYFDAMLSAAMVENNTSRIEFPDKDPEEWTLFYSFIDPVNLSGSRDAIIDWKIAMKLVPWFHEFQMEAYLRKCDQVISDILETHSRLEDDGTPVESFWGKDVDTSQSRLRKRKQVFERNTELLQSACLYDLEKTKGAAEKVIKALLVDFLPGSIDLFDRPTIRILLDLFLPLEEAGEGKFEDGTKWLEPRGKSKALWNFLDGYNEFGSKCLRGLSIDAINSSNELLPVLVESNLNLYASNKKLQDVRESTSTIFNNGWLANLPLELANRLPNTNVVPDRKMAAHDCLVAMLRGHYNKHKESFNKLGVAPPSSLSLMEWMGLDEEEEAEEG